MGKILKTIRALLPVRITFVISIALFMETVDTSILNTAIPVMAKSLNVNAIDLKLALISYLVTLAVFIPISGWIADKFGAKRTFMAALSIFTIASLFCGFAPSLTTLVTARALQGLGGSLMMPVGRLVIARTFKRHELIHIMSRVTIVAAVGSLLGPTLGGYITHYFSWHWIFWVNIPIGLMAIIMAYAWLPESKMLDVPPLDKRGFCFFGAGLAGLTFGLAALSEIGWQHRPTMILMFCSIALLILYGRHSKQQEYPIIKTQLFSQRSFQIAILGNLFVRMSFTGLPFLLPLLLQIGLGYPPQVAGLLMSPIAFGVLLMKPLSIKIMHKFGFKHLLILNTLCVGLTLWLFMLINQTTSYWIIVGLTALFGFLIALQYTAMNALTYADIKPEDLSASTSIMSTTQQFAQSLGVTLAALLISTLSLLPTKPAQLTPVVFHHAFFIMGWITLLSGTIFLRLRPTDGHQML